MYSNQTTTEILRWDLSHASEPLHFVGKVTSSFPKIGRRMSATNIGQIAIHPFIFGNIQLMAV